MSTPSASTPAAPAPAPAPAAPAVAADPINTYVSAVAADPALSAEGITPGIIAAIIATIMQLISGCVPTPALAPADVINQAGTSPRWLVMVYRGMLGNGIRPRSSQGQAILKAMQAQAAKMSVADAQGFLDQCRGGW